MEKKQPEIYNRKAIFSDLKDYCIFSIKSDSNFMEVTQWGNGEGFDVEITTTGSEAFSMTYGQFKLLKKLIKELDK